MQSPSYALPCFTPLRRSAWIALVLFARIVGATLCGAIWIGWTAAAEIDKAAPLIRDVHVGYLANCTFRAIRPYLWKQTPILSGWETDASGGTWEASPSGFFPDGFAFHTNWFKLHDTSPQRAVTIRRRIARQTEGKITLEFRFMLPRPMDGAAWQLRDLSDVAFGIVVRGGTLSYETPNGAVALVPMEPGHGYGVRVVADLARQTADVCVDGELRARSAPFVHPVRSLDYVLVKTGDASVGDMFLPLVRVSKGYSVAETFATCAVGRTPADWDVNRRAGAAEVEEFRCSSGPDAFSLKLTDGSEASKRFDPCAGKVVWEFKLLLPEKHDGASATLIGKAGRAGKIVSANGSFCYLSPQGKLVPVLQDYRADLWYEFKVIADPTSGKAEIFVNGKLACPAADFLPPDGAFEAVRFDAAGRGAMWADDVRVYPWRDYPPDYVPPPRPVPRHGEYLLGVQSCSLWKDGDAYAGWEYVVPFARQRKPYLGWYDEGNPEVADWEIKWQIEHGIDFELYCWYRPNDAINHPIKDGVLEQGIRDGLFNARYSALKKFAIMYTNQGAGQTNLEDWQKHIIPYWIEYFFKDPRYLKIDGKPFLSIYDRELFLRDFGGAEGCRKAIDVLREQCARAGFPGVIVVMQLACDADVMRLMKSIGFDGCYRYTWGTPDVSRQRQYIVAQRDAAAAAGFRMLPSMAVGWQTSPWDGSKDPGNGWAPVAEYRALARWAKNEFMPSLPQGSLGRRVLLLSNWNEFGEGHFIMPSNLAGFGYLDALREVLSDGGPHYDAVPTAGQKQRFNVLFPKE